MQTLRGNGWKEGLEQHAFEISVCSIKRNAVSNAIDALSAQQLGTHRIPFAYTSADAIGKMV